MLDISDLLPGSCGRITDDPPDHTAARSPRSSEFRRLPGRASGVGFMSGSAPSTYGSVRRYRWLGRIALLPIGMSHLSHL